MIQMIFYALAGVIVAGALLVVTLKNLYHCALALAMTMFCVAGVYLFLGWEFLAAVQVLIYVGAVTVLIIFGIMLTRRVMDDDAKTMNKQALLSLVAAVAFGLILFSVLQRANLQGNERPVPVVAAVSADGAQPAPAPVASYPSDVVLLSEALLKPQNGFAFAFEFVSVLLLSALVGAVVVARKDPA
jgi:NADH:ubiquinone oxidoreductase subunit 6 (subunit J)